MLRPEWCTHHLPWQNRTSILQISLANLICGLFFTGLFASLADASDLRSKQNPSINTGSNTYLCPQFTVHGEINPGLSDVEKRLVCGDREKDAPDAWKTIPYHQAKFNLSNFLQQRGYHHPRFHPQDPEFKKVEIFLGEKTPITRVSVEGIGGEIQIQRMRKVIGEPLTPEILDRIEKWIADHLGELGYACPQVKSQANSETGEVIVRVDPGMIQSFLGVTEEPISDTYPGVLQRYNAFHLGQRYDSSLLAITENRVTGSKIVQSTYLSTRCITQGVYLHHHLIPGPPRLITAGFGVNTEGLLLGRLTWQNTRLGNWGSSMNVSAYASARRQSLTSTVNWYFLPYVSRYYISPQASIVHRNEQQFEDVSATAQIGPATTVEFPTLGASIFLGPTAEFFRTYRGSGANSSRLFSLENRISVQSHAYERFLNNPRTGYTASLTTDINSKSLFSDVTAQRFNLKGEMLFNWKDFDPPLWIFGIRTGLNTILTDSSREDMPASLLQYLGGTASLRGFGRLELPVDTGGGGLTSVYLGIEARLSNTLPYNLDPFVFIDLGAIGFNSASLDSPMYWSPGVGLRWASPVGPLRTTLAHGYSNSTPNHFQFFLSLGEEF